MLSVELAPSSIRSVFTLEHTYSGVEISIFNGTSDGRFISGRKRMRKMASPIFERSFRRLLFYPLSPSLPFFFITRFYNPRLFVRTTLVIKQISRSLYFSLNHLVFALGRSFFKEKPMKSILVSQWLKISLEVKRGISFSTIRMVKMRYTVYAYLYNG